MSNLKLARWAEDLIGQGYIYGGYFDRIITAAYIEQKRLQYKGVKGSPYDDGNNGYTYAKRQSKWIGKKGGDCVGLIKSYYWFDGTQIRYGWQGRADTNAHGLYNRATVKGPISTIPDIVGLAVYYYGSSMCHVGVYIGGGWVVESRGSDYGVVKTRLKDRPWTHWFEVPYISYEGEDEMFAIRGQGTIAKPDPAVTALQNAFLKLKVEMKNDKGEVFTKADGSYGGATANAVKVFEKKYGLVATNGNSFTNAHLTILLSHLTVAAGSDCTALESQVKTLSGQLSTIRSAVDVLRKL